MPNPELKLQIAVFPWLAFGHMLPYLELCKLIARKGHKILFISTPKNIDRLPKPPQDIASLITFVKLPLPRIENLPENAEATSDLPPNEVPYLKKAYDVLQDSVAKFILASQPDWLFYDILAFRLPSLVTKLGLRHGLFSILTAACLGYIGPTLTLDYRKTPEDYTMVPKWVPFPSTVAFRPHEVLINYDGMTGDENNVSDLVRFREVMKGADVIITRSCFEFEPEWLQLLEDLHQKPVLPIGQLFPSDYDRGEENEAWLAMKQWLDKQEKTSVVYVAFGSEAKPSQNEITEIALGLELSNLPFFWVLKTSRGSFDTDVLELPEGFEERTKGRGVVCTDWAPQINILAHESIGGFLTHCGWSSVVESMHFGRPLIILTCFADQGLNSRVLEEKKMGYSIPRDERDGSFTRNMVAESLRLIVVEEGGKIYRERADEMRDLFQNRNVQEKCVDKFLGCIMNYKKKPDVNGVQKASEVYGVEKI